MPVLNWTVEAARSVIEAAGFDLVSKERTRNGYGTALRSADGVLVVVYDSGKVLCQTKRMADTKRLFTGTPPVIWSSPQGPKDVAAAPLPVLATTSPATNSTAVRFVRDILGPGGVGDTNLPR